MKNLAFIAAPVIAMIVIVFAQRNSMLHKGAAGGKTGMMSLGLMAGADKDSYNDAGATPVMAAAEAGQLQAVQALIQKKANVNKKHRDNGTTALMLAAKGGHAEIVDALLAAGAAVDVRDKDDRTAYSYAFQNNNFEVARKVKYIAANNVELTSTASPAKGPKTAPHTGKQIRTVTDWERSKPATVR